MTLPGLISRAGFVKGDPYVAGNDSNTKLLLHCEGNNNATTMIDSSSSAHTGFSFTGEAIISTALKKFGKSSLRMGIAQAHSAVCSLTYYADLELGTGNFTLDAWAYHTAAPWGSIIFGDNGVGFQWGLDMGTAGVNLWGPSGSGLYRASGYNTALTLNTWHHIATVREGTTFRHYIDGLLCPTVTTGDGSDLTSGGSSPWYIGGGGTYGLPGNVDELRLSKVVRYTSNFTPPAFRYGPP